MLKGFLIISLVFMTYGFVLFTMKGNSVADPFTPSGVPRHLQGLNPDTVDWKSKDTAYWKSVLPEPVYRITRQAGTERAFTGKFHAFKEKGVYRCFNCGLALFSSEEKFDSGTGWPSFWKAIDKGAVRLKRDSSWGMARTEVICGRCGAHLGHVFPDGPPPTGERFCINSLSLFYEKAAQSRP